MLEGVPQRLAGIREAPLTRIALWSVVAGSIVLDLTTLRGSMQDRISVVVGFSLLSLLIYFVIRTLIGRGMANERMHAAVVQLAGFLILFLGIVASFTLARALTDRGFAATMAVFHASWALGALDGYRRADQPSPQPVAETPSLPSTIPLEPDGGWKIETGDYRRVFEALRDLVGPAATICVIGARDEGAVRLLSALSTPPTHRLGDVGTWWPRPHVFHIPATGPNLEELAQASDRYAEPEFMDHLVVYEAGTNLLEWWDALDDPIRIAAGVPEEAVQRFAASLGTRATRVDL